MAQATEFTAWDKAVMVPVDQLVFTDWNCNEMSKDNLAQLMSDIEAENDGQVRFDEPIQVVPIKGMEDRWLVIGGEHRTKVMIGLQQETIPCVIRWDLADKSRKELMLWSVRRNNLRGKLNAQKYAELEDELINDHDMTAEAARQGMLISDELARALTASNISAADDEDTDDDSPFDQTKPRQDETAKKAAEDQRSKSELLNALKVVEQDVLLDSADTVEHGYLFFVQGKKGQTHLIVDESAELHSLVAKMVSSCKSNEDKVDEFLSSAIENELKRMGSA